MIKKKKNMDIDKIILNINKLIHLHDCTFVKLCNKKGKLVSITAIDNMEYKDEESLIYLERKINDVKETVNVFIEDCVKDIKYISDKKDDTEALVVTVTY